MFKVDKRQKNCVKIFKRSCPDVSAVNFEHISQAVQVFLSLNLNR